MTLDELCIKLVPLIDQMTFCHRKSGEGEDTELKAAWFEEFKKRSDEISALIRLYRENKE